MDFFCISKMNHKSFLHLHIKNEWGKHIAIKCLLREHELVKLRRHFMNKKTDKNVHSFIKK
jgi:hypothetical protein